MQPTEDITDLLFHRMRLSSLILSPNAPLAECALAESAFAECALAESAVTRSLVSKAFLFLFSKLPCSG
jgi:hypothetical protein